MKQAFEQFILRQIEKDKEIIVSSLMLEDLGGDDFVTAHKLRKYKAQDETFDPKDDRIKLVLDKAK